MAGPPLTCWVGWPGPLVASVPETDALRYPARNLVSPTPSSGCAITNRGPGPVAPDLRRTIILIPKEGPAYLLLEREFHDPNQQLVGSRGIKACPTV